MREGGWDPFLFCIFERVWGAEKRIMTRVRGAVHVGWVLEGVRGRGKAGACMFHWLLLLAFDKRRVCSVK